jgi:6-phospho-3-hexuloisomerase
MSWLLPPAHTQRSEGDESLSPTHRKESDRAVAHSLSRWLVDALDELRSVSGVLDPEAIESLVSALAEAEHVVTYGVGREGLMMRALCMRLMHAGLDAHVIGDMSTPAVGKGDLLVVSAGPGEFSTVLALQGVARAAGARIAVITANGKGRAAQCADLVLIVPAHTMADGPQAEAALPMGSAFEAVELLLSDLLALRLRELKGETVEQMRSRHTNLE